MKLKIFFSPKQKKTHLMITLKIIFSNNACFIYIIHFIITIYRLSFLCEILIVQKTQRFLAKVYSAWLSSALQFIRQSNVVRPNIEFESFSADDAAQYRARVNANAHIHSFTSFNVELFYGFYHCYEKTYTTNLISVK